MSDRIDKTSSCILPLLVMLICVFFYYVNPSANDYPLKCIWYVLTQTKCPACGIQRAVHALVHGHLREAVSQNYFFFISIPFLIAVLLSEWYCKGKWQTLHSFIHNKYTLYTYTIIYLFWWIIRNLLHL
ncbi:MAG: DUF2752 domain-containing protein [Prevotella sp.]|nr:DUF2752 domain-containing protein [Prevotella sp.]